MGEQIVSIKEMIIDKIAQKLKGCSETARLDAEILVGRVLKKSRAELFAYPETLLTKEQKKK